MINMYYFLQNNANFICHIAAILGILSGLTVVIILETKNTACIINILKNKYLFYLTLIFIVILGLLTTTTFFEFSNKVYKAIMIGNPHFKISDYIFSKAFLIQSIVYFSCLYLIILGFAGMIFRRKLVYDNKLLNIVKITSITLLFAGIMSLISLKYLQ